MFVDGVCAEVQSADNMQRLARCLALIVIENYIFTQTKCTDNDVKASRGKFETFIIQNGQRHNFLEDEHDRSEIIQLLN